MSQLQGMNDEVVGAGLAFNLAGIRQVVPGNTLKGVEGVFDLIRELREEPCP